MQNNVQIGAIALLANSDLTGMEDRLVKIVSDSGVAKFDLPSANTDECNFVLVKGGAADTQVEAIPFEASRQFRIVAEGAIAVGDRLCLADVSTAADKGMLRKLPAGAGDYRCFARAEGAAADGALALVRKADAETVTVS